jgi:hypothetical protein
VGGGGGVPGPFTVISSGCAGATSPRNCVVLQEGFPREVGGWGGQRGPSRGHFKGFDFLIFFFFIYIFFDPKPQPIDAPPRPDKRL